MLSAIVIDFEAGIFNAATLMWHLGYLNGAGVLDDKQRTAANRILDWVGATGSSRAKTRADKDIHSLGFSIEQ